MTKLRRTIAGSRSGLGWRARCRTGPATLTVNICRRFLFAVWTTSCKPLRRRSACDTGSFFSPTWFTIPAGEQTGKLELKTNAIAKDVLVDENGHAKGVAY